MAVDIKDIANALATFIVGHQTEFTRLSARRSQLLEVGALSMAAEHYTHNGYDVEPRNLVQREFRVKQTTRGLPWNFSWFAASRGSEQLEIHANLPVQDAVGTDGAQYVVDVAVIRAGSLPTTKPTRAGWARSPNDQVVTFIEAKALVIYPMLLAQFVGIVHEIKPDFLGGRRPQGFVTRLSLGSGVSPLA